MRAHSAAHWSGSRGPAGNGFGGRPSGAEPGGSCSWEPGGGGSSAGSCTELGSASWLGRSGAAPAAPSSGWYVGLPYTAFEVYCSGG